MKDDWYEHLQLAQTLKAPGGGNRIHDPRTGRFATYGSSAPSKRKKGGKVGRPKGSGSGSSETPSYTTPKPRVSVERTDSRTSAAMARMPLGRFVDVRDPGRNDALRDKLNSLGDGTVINGWTKVVKGDKSYWQSGKQVLVNLPESVLDRSVHKGIIVKALKDGVLPPMQAIALHSRDYPQIANWPIMKTLIGATAKEAGYVPSSAIALISQVRNTMLASINKNALSKQMYLSLSHKAFSPKKNKLKKHLEAVDGKAIPTEQKKFSLQKKQPATMFLAQNAGYTRLGGFENPKYINLREPDETKRAIILDFMPASVLVSKVYSPATAGEGKVKRKNIFGPQVIMNAHPLENTSPFYYNKRGSNYTAPKTKPKKRVTKKEQIAYSDELAENLKARKPRNYRREYDNFHGTPKQIKLRGLRNRARRESGLKVGDPREVDHIVPLSKGGSAKKTNLRIVSRHTNRSKMAKTTKEYIAYVITRCFKSRGLKL